MSETMVGAFSVIPPFVLASASPRRVELLAQIGVRPEEVTASAIDETPLRAELPKDYALRVAIQKAEAVAHEFPQSRILAADTVVAVGRRILGKAADERDARKMLALLSGRRHRVYTALCLRKDESNHTRIVMTQVQFKRLHADEITTYLATEEWRDKAGAYGIQGYAARFIPRINGSYSNVVGLPLVETANLLAL
jgi:septum formation protein